MRLGEGHAYVEWEVTDEQAKLGTFQLCDLRQDGSRYEGTCRAQWPVRWFDSWWTGQWKTRLCQVEGRMELPKYSPSRIEGRTEARGVGEEWSDKDRSNCGKRLPLKWDEFVWVRPD